jgi:hypothetical protein
MTALTHLWAPLAYFTLFGFTLAAGGGSPEARVLLGRDEAVTATGFVMGLPAAMGLVWISVRGWRSLSWIPDRPADWSWGLRMLLAATLALVVYASSTQIEELHRIATTTTDFGTLYRAATAISQGRDPYTSGPGEYFYPPVLATLGAVFTWIPVGWASTVWFAVKLGVLSWSIQMIVHLLPLQRFSEASRPWIVLGTIAGGARFWLADLQFGNTNIVVMSLGVLALFSALKKSHVVAGLALGLAGGIKVVPLVAATWFAARGDWRTILWACVTVAALVGATAATPMGMVELWEAYWTHGVVAKLGADLSGGDNQSLLGSLSRLSLGRDLTLALWYASSGLVLGMVGLSSYLTRGSDRQHSSCWSAPGAGWCTMSWPCSRWRWSWPSVTLTVEGGWSESSGWQSSRSPSLDGVGPR